MENFRPHSNKFKQKSRVIYREQNWDLSKYMCAYFILNIDILKLPTK